MKVLLDTNVYLGALRSGQAADRFRSAYFPLLPATVLSAVVAYELAVDAADRGTRELLEQFLEPMERAGRVVAPAFGDWSTAARVVTSIGRRDGAWRSKLPALLNDVLIALCARRVGAVLLTYNVADFRLIRRHVDFAVRFLAA